MKNIKKLFNDDWVFYFDKKDQQNITLPHDWLINDVHNLYKTSVGHYKKSFTIDNDLSRHFIRFDGIYMDSQIFINGNLAAEWKYGYTSFEVEITEFLNKGGNEIFVLVNYESGNSRWYTGAGIYRNVYLVSTNKVHIPYNGVYVSPVKLANGWWDLKIDVELVGEGEVSHEVYHMGYAVQDYGKPRLWSVDDPNLYTLVTSVFVAGELTHVEETDFGFREIAFDRDKGFFLNGKHLKLQGVCQHHDLGALGAAFNEQALERQFGLLKEMGVNAIRCGHNPPDPYFMHLADKMGFLVISEIFDTWERAKTAKDYSRFFADWFEKDVTAWVKRDRNHPSLIMWSIGNEIYDTHADPNRAKEVLDKLKQIVHRNDYNFNAYVTLASNYLPWENTQAVADALPSPKLVGYNYGEYLYAKHYEKYADWVIYGSETASVVQSRGIYHFPLSQSVLADDDEQCSSLGNSQTSWGAKSIEGCILNDLNTPYSLGQFIWTGTDYIGEPTPYHTKNSYFGQIDTAGFRKDSFFVYKSAWTSHKTAPFVHIFPYWDFSPGQIIDVQVASNCPKIELFFNGVSRGTFEKNSKELVGKWQIAYEDGMLEAKGYDENGEIIAIDKQTSFGDVAEVKTKINRQGNMVFAEIYAIDEHGYIVHNANRRVNVAVLGGRLLGLDNGDSTDYDQYKTNSKRLFSGRLLAIAEVFEEDFEIKVSLDEKDIPIRKIELNRSNLITSENKTTNIRAELYPEDSSYNDVTWRVTDAAGIDSNIADFSVSKCGMHLKLTAKGDGTVYVRCNAKNGREKISLISYLDFEITGLGKAYLNPYEFVAGGLYNASNIPMSNGNDRGVATSRDEISHVGFAGVDFGELGADEIELPIFGMTQDEFPIEIWEGMPNEGGEKIYEAIYKSGSKWNTYIPETYKLPRRLKGITTICFVVYKKIHIKGFKFKKIEKAYEKLSAASYTQIYGDSYKIDGDAVTNIGNNTTLEFSQMQLNASKLLLSGRGRIDNTIHLKLDDSNTILLEFPKSDEYVTREFTLNASSNEKVSFVFLPGSDFDFGWFRFM